MAGVAGAEPDGAEMVWCRLGADRSSLGRTGYWEGWPPTDLLRVWPRGRRGLLGLWRGGGVLLFSCKLREDAARAC